MATDKQIEQAKKDAERENKERGERIAEGSRQGEGSYGQQTGIEYG